MNNWKLLLQIMKGNYISYFGHAHHFSNCLTCQTLMHVIRSFGLSVCLPLLSMWLRTSYWIWYHLIFLWHDSMCINLISNQNKILFIYPFEICMLLQTYFMIYALPKIIYWYCNIIYLQGQRFCTKIINRNLLSHQHNYHFYCDA